MSRPAGGQRKDVKCRSGIRIERIIRVCRPELDVRCVAFVVGWHLGERCNIPPTDTYQHRATGWLSGQRARGNAQIAVLAEAIVSDCVDADGRIGDGGAHEQQSRKNYQMDL